MSRPTDFGLLVVGSAPVFRASFSIDEVPVDPDNVTFTWRNASDSQTWTYGVNSEVVRDSSGHYSVTLPIDTSGRWYGRWAVTGDPAAGASELTFGAWTNFPEA